MTEQTRLTLALLKQKYKWSAQKVTYIKKVLSKYPTSTSFSNKLKTLNDSSLDNMCKNLKSLSIQNYILYINNFILPQKSVNKNLKAIL